MDAVRVHYNSAEPAKLQALAYTRGAEIYVGPGQESHLPHEAWHVVQQASGAVGPTTTLGGVPINDDPALEREADEMGARTLAARDAAAVPDRPAPAAARPVAGVDASDAPIQRLVGFEVELNVPTYGPGLQDVLKPGPGGEPAAIVADFLTGGLEYDTSIGEIGVHRATWPGRIELSTDKNPLKVLAGNLFESLQRVTYNEEPLAGDVVLRPDLSNLEYKTPAWDELQPGSDKQFEALATAIDNHAASIFENEPADKDSEIPDANSATGLPREQFLKWLVGDDYRKLAGTGYGHDIIGPLRILNEIKEKIIWHMSVQATAGLLPSGIPSIYKQPGRYPGLLQGHFTSAVDAVSRGLSVLEKTPYFEQLNGDMQRSGGNRADFEAFLGGIALVISFEVGKALYQTDIINTTKKNAVPLLAKTDLDRFRGATTTWLQEEFIDKMQPDIRNAMYKKISGFIHELVPETRAEFWLASGAGRVQGRALLHQAYDSNDLTATSLLLKRVLGGEGTIQTVTTGNPLPGLDPAPQVIRNDVGGQRGYPLEYRWITVTPRDRGQLWDVFHGVLDQVRKANIAHVPDDQRRAILERL
jgi:hypothetical protein